MNTILDDISAVIGFSATLKLVAWFGDGISNCFVPMTLSEDSTLVKIVGLSAAQRLVQEFPRQHLPVPGLHAFDVEIKRRTIARLITRGISHREIAGILKMSQKRVQQIEGELILAQLLTRPVAEPTAPPTAHVAPGYGQLSDTSADTAMRGLVAAAKEAERVASVSKRKRGTKQSPATCSLAPADHPGAISTSPLAVATKPPPPSASTQGAPVVTAVAASTRSGSTTGGGDLLDDILDV